MQAWRVFFAIAAFFNMAVATAMLVAPGQMAGHLSIGGAGAPYVVATLGILIGAFGLGYAIVSSAPSRNHGIVWMGLVGKLGVAAMAMLQFAAGMIPFSYFALGMGDLVFAVMFGLFLWRMRHQLGGNLDLARARSR
jgi:hypothetical protein